jgi:hypothetical protein
MPHPHGAAAIAQEQYEAFADLPSELPRSLLAIQHFAYLGG